MRGLAAVVAGLAAWVLVTGRVSGRSHLPRVTLPTGAEIGAMIAAGLATGLLALGILQVPAAGAGFGILGSTIPLSLAAIRRSRQVEQVAERWPDLLALLRSELAGGASLPEAFESAAARTGSLPDHALNRFREISRHGGGFSAAVTALRDEIGDATADRVLATLLAAHRAGGHRVGEILAVLTESIGDEIRLRKAHHAALTQQRLTALVALIAPWALLALTIATNPESAVAYRSRGGTTVVATGLVATLVGYGTARRTARLSAPERVLR